MLPAYPLGGNWHALHARAEGLLADLRLAHRRTATIEHLSGGEQQRVPIARAPINDPQVISADEPTAHLDTALPMEFMTILEQLSAAGRMVNPDQPRPAGGRPARWAHRPFPARTGQMIFQPATIALLLASLACVGLLLAAAPVAIDLIRHWNIASGSERQIQPERRNYLRTYLLSTLPCFIFVTQLVPLLLFVCNADRLSSLFVGAMCAVGTPQVRSQLPGPARRAGGDCPPVRRRRPADDLFLRP